jgi:hypothetical protein
MHVRAIKPVFFGGNRHRPGKTELFEIPDTPTRPLRKSDDEVTRLIANKKGEVPAAFSSNSMRPVSADAPEKPKGKPREADDSQVI